MGSESRDDLNEILRRLEVLDEHLNQLNNRLSALEQHTGRNMEPVPPDASLETFDAEVESTAGVTEDAAAREAFAESEIAEPAPAPPELPAESKLTPQPAIRPARAMPAIPLPPLTADARGLDPAEGMAAKSGYTQSPAEGVYPRLKPKQPKESLEMRIASTWLPWIGLLFLALAAGFLAREYARGPLGKVVFAYIVSFALIVVGLWKEKKYTHWARPVLAGGLAFSYFTSYAMGFVEPMRLIDNLVVKLAILAANLALMFGVAQWKRSEVIAATALVLGYITTGSVGSEMAAFSSAVALSVVALVFLWLNKWFISTALAVVATYLAHLYVWLAMPDTGRTAAESFWFHSMFLSLYFVVFTAAAFAGKVSGRASLNEPAGDFGKLRTLSRFEILTTLTQINVGFYLAGMISVLKITEIYWDRSWLFFLPMVAVFGGLGLLFGALRAIRNIHFVAAILCLTLGVAALASPMWLPVYMVFQALALLWGAREKNGAVWQILSLLSLVLAFLYIVSGGQIDVLRISADLNYIKFPMWTFIAVTALILGYSGLWEKRFADSSLKIGYMVPGAVAIAAGMVWGLLDGNYPAPELLPVFALAVPVVAVCAVFFRCHWLALFMFWVGVGSLADTWLSGSDVSLMGAMPAVTGAAAMAAGVLMEKRGTVSARWDAAMWRGLYMWGQLMILAYLAWLDGHQVRVLSVTGLYLATIVIGWLLRSSAFAKSAYFAVPVLVAVTEPFANKGFNVIPVSLAVAAALLAGAYPVATPAWRKRTGDTTPNVSQWAQAGVVFAAGLVITIAGWHLEWNGVLAIAAWAFVAACFAAIGLFPKVTSVAVSYMILSAIALVLLTSDIWYGNTDGRDLQQTTMACIVAVLLIVAAERILRIVPGIRMRRNGGLQRSWLSNDYASQLTGGVAIGSLVMAIMSLRILPDLQHFYFTGAIVGSAFVWIVFGFWFNESAYRKSGFFALCIGLVKGLIWDLWNLKEPIYRIISGALVGLLAIAASFLYTRFRGRVGSETESSHEPIE